MEPECSLPHSQVPATCPYLVATRSSPYPTSHFLKIHLSIILSSRPWSPKWSFSIRVFNKTLHTPIHFLNRATCPILKHPQPTFLPECEHTSFTPTQNNRQSYISLCLNHQIDGLQSGRQKILHRMIAFIAWINSALNYFLNRILICYGCSEISELFHPFKDTIINLCTVNSSCIVISNHDHVLC